MRLSQMVRDVTASAEIGKTYLGKVVRLAEFGAFVELFPGTDGLLHISEISEHRIRDVRDELKLGDQVLVKVLSIEGNKVRLSRKALIKEAREKQQKAAAGGGTAPARSTAAIPAQRLILRFTHLRSTKRTIARPDPALRFLFACEPKAAPCCPPFLSILALLTPKQEASHSVGGLFYIPLCSLLFPSLIRYFFASLAMHRVQRSPKRIQRLVRRRQNLILIPIRVLFQPSAPRRPVRLVRFLVHRKIRQPFRIRHTVEFLQSVDLRRRDLRHLRLHTHTAPPPLPTPAGLRKFPGISAPPPAFQAGQGSR